jgi:hypothetical protein
MLIKVKVVPNSIERKIIKKNIDEFTLQVKSEPIRGKANREAKKILAHYFQVPLMQIRLKRGFKRRNKIFEIIKK